MSLKGVDFGSDEASELSIDEELTKEDFVGVTPSGARDDYLLRDVRKILFARDTRDTTRVEQETNEEPIIDKEPPVSDMASEAPMRETPTIDGEMAETQQPQDNLKSEPMRYESRRVLSFELARTRALRAINNPGSFNEQQLNEVAGVMGLDTSGAKTQPELVKLLKTSITTPGE